MRTHYETVAEIVSCETRQGPTIRYTDAEGKAVDIPADIECDEHISEFKVGDRINFRFTFDESGKFFIIGALRCECGAGGRYCPPGQKCVECRCVKG